MAGPRQPRKKKAAPSAADELRRQAEERLDKLSAAASPSSPVPEELDAVVHDLRVHQIELEMQNEELRRAQLELEAQRAKYFELFDLAPVGYLTLSDGSIVGDANFTAARLLGVERQELVKKPFSALIFAPDQDVYYRHQRMLEQSGEPQTYELRLRRAAAAAGADAGPEAGHFWARLEGRPQRAADGATLSFWVTFTDVEAQVAAQETLRESEERYRSLFEDNHAVMLLIDPESGAITDANPAACAWYGWSREEMLAMRMEQIGTLSSAAVRAEMESARAKRRRVFFSKHRRADGSIRDVEVYSGLIELQGKTLLYSMVHDITARKRAEEKLAHLNDELAAKAAALEAANATITRIAATDHLTGLANRRHFLESLEKAVSLARRHGSPLALVSFDLDGLKRVNDSSGHQAGDEVLTSFAALLSSLCRIEDLPARLGGDEFSLLLPGIDLRGARALAERVLAAVRSCAALEQRGVTVSGGVAQWSADDLAADLLRRADEALYAAKNRSGDSVAVDG